MRASYKSDEISHVYVENRLPAYGIPEELRFTVGKWVATGFQDRVSMARYFAGYAVRILLKFPNRLAQPHPIDATKSVRSRDLR